MSDYQMMPDEEVLFEKLWGVATAKASQAGFKIAEDCETLLRDFVSKGGRRLIAEGHYGDDAKLREAERNIEQFVRGMAAAARTMGFADLHEPTFFKALRDLCPLWPFC